MMRIKPYCLVIISSFVFSFAAHAQEIYPGSRKNIKTNTIDVVYYLSTLSANKNVYYNHYSILRKLKGSKYDTIFTIDLNFDRTNNSIKINQFDWATDEYDSKTIQFQPLSSSIKKSDVKPIYCVKNYVFNDTLLSLTKDENATILFTIADTLKPMIFLHQLISADGNYRFELDKFKKSYLTPHLAHSRDYREWEKSKSIISKLVRDSIQRAEKDALNAKRAVLQAKIIQEIVNINADKDYEIDKLTKKQEDAKKLPDTMASEKAQKSFMLKMDKIFNEYLSSTHCSNTQIAGSYKFYVYPNQPVSIVKQPPIFLTDWMTTQQFIIIDTLLKKIPFEKTELSLCTDDPYGIIFQKHISRTEALKPEMYKMNLKFDSVFKSTLESAQLAINNICKSKIQLTTIYTYPFKYITKSEWERWTLKNKKIKNSNDSLIENKKSSDQFYAKLPKAKNGKYDVRLNTTILNNRSFGPDLDSVNLKYKFLTRIGISAGTFITNDGKFTTGTDATTGEIFFWNLSLIYHHIGVFGGTNASYGKSSLPQSDPDVPITYLKNYTEAGLYVAPGKFFYFKVGLAKYNTINKNAAGNAINESKSTLMPLVGASLMFPVFQIEAGYNFALKYSYVMTGFNIPLNL